MLTNIYFLGYSWNSSRHPRLPLHQELLQEAKRCWNRRSHGQGPPRPSPRPRRPRGLPSPHARAQWQDGPDVSSRGRPTRGLGPPGARRGGGVRGQLAATGWILPTSSSNKTGGLVLPGARRQGGQDSPGSRSSAGRYRVTSSQRGRKGHPHRAADMAAAAAANDGDITNADVLTPHTPGANTTARTRPLFLVHGVGLGHVVFAGEYDAAQQRVGSADRIPTPGEPLGAPQSRPGRGTCWPGTKPATT